MKTALVARYTGSERAVRRRCMGSMQAGVAALSSTAFVYFVANGLRSWRFPWPVDYGEGPLLDQARRLASGANIYPPTFGAYQGLVSNYPPIYPWLFAVAGKCVGLSLATGRAIGFAAACGCAGLVGAFVHRITGRWTPSFLAMALFAVSPAVLLWSMFARVDFVALAFALTSIHIVASRPHARWAPLAAAGLNVLAVFTRQSQLIAGPLAVATGLWLGSPRKALSFAAAFVVSTAAMVLVLQAATRGGFWLHVVTANVQEFQVSRVLDAAKRFFTSNAPALAALAVPCVWKKRCARSQRLASEAPAQVVRDERGHAILGAYAIGCVASAVTVGKAGSAVNHLLPLVAAVAMGAGIAFDRVMQELLHATGGIGCLELAVAGMVLAQIPWGALGGANAVDAVEDSFRARAQLAALSAAVQSERDPVLADEAMGVVVAAGHALVVDPFDLTQLARRGTASQDVLVRDIRAQRFGLILVSDTPATSPSSVSERWTPEMLAAIHEAYGPSGVLARSTLYRRRMRGVPQVEAQDDRNSSGAD